MYCCDLSKQLTLSLKSNQKLGSKLTEEVLNSLKEDQIAQIYELFKAAKNIENDPISSNKL